MSENSVEGVTMSENSYSQSHLQLSGGATRINIPDMVAPPTEWRCDRINVPDMTWSHLQPSGCVINHMSLRL